MNRFIPGFLTSNAEEQPPEEHTPMSNEPPLTRSRSANLQIPFVPGPDSIAARGRRASRSPSSETAGRQFFTTMATPEQLQAIRDELRTEIRAEIRNETAAAAAQVPDAIKRKPEIPPFDRKHIENWIRRTENAFIRALCNTPREKFAFLETKFPVDFNPRINEYLWGDATEPKWQEFLAYLRSEYGTTKQQQAAIILDGFKRDGKKPSQFAALLDEKTKDLTLEDVKKEMLVREMPTDVQRMLQERIEKLSFKEAAKIADAYFDQDGKPRQVNRPTVNAIQDTAQDLTTSPSDEEDINAINRRFPNQRHGGNSNNNQNYGRSRTSRGWHARTAPKASTAFPRIETSGFCSYHDRHGDNALRCMVTCPRYDEKRFPGNGKAGK